MTTNNEQQPQPEPVSPQPAEAPEAVLEAPRKHWWQRRLTVYTAIVVMVLALVAGLTILLLQPDAAQSRKPFDDAVASLAEAKGVRYSAPARPTGAVSAGASAPAGQATPGTHATQPTPAGGSASTAVTTTANGDIEGTVNAGGHQIQLLSAGGKTFIKPQPDGDWMLVGKPTEQVVEQRFPTPAALADKLKENVTGVQHMPSKKSLETVVDGTPAYMLPTGEGTLYVTRESPSRILRWQPNQPGTSNLPNLTLPSLPDLGGTAPIDSELQEMEDVLFLLTSNGGITDAEPMSPIQVSNVYNKMEQETEQLATAKNPNISLDLSANPTVTCGDTGCTLTADFTGVLVADQGSIIGGEVTAELTGTFTVNGVNAGRCTTPPKSFPVNGDKVKGELSCTDPEAGAVFAEQKALAKERAEAQSKAEGGAAVQYTVPYQGEADVEADALAKDEIDSLEKQEKQAQQNLGG